MRDYWPTQDLHKAASFGLIALAMLGNAPSANGQAYQQVKWAEFVKVEGQSEPIPKQWLQDEEARIAHSLKLPDSIPKPVPFDFGWGLGSSRSQSVAYFNHLCSTEAGEWIFKKVPNVEGFYFARPQGAPTSDTMTDPYGPEMPWIQRKFMLTSDRPLDQGWWFVLPPEYNYHFIEQPRRATAWQKDISEPYIRLFGYTREYFVKDGQVVADWNERTPMQVIGIPTRTARYGYTWRGIKRPKDREHGIAGGELIIYDLQTEEILAVRRQFLIASHNPRGEGKAMWEIAAKCSPLGARHTSAEISQFAFDTLQTTKPSSSGN